MAMGDTYDPRYRIRHRLPKTQRLAKYERLPPPMAGDPPEASSAASWGQRCQIVYDYLIGLKRGVVPMHDRRGLWFHQ